jgi:modification methylase
MARVLQSVPPTFTAKKLGERPVAHRVCHRVGLTFGVHSKCSLFHASPLRCRIGFRSILEVRATMSASKLTPLLGRLPEPVRPRVVPRRLMEELPTLPATDNTAEALRALIKANEYYRVRVWPEGFRRTVHSVRRGDARDLKFLANESIHLVVTSPPYWTLKQYERGNGLQLGDIEDYEAFLNQLDLVWAECKRLLVPGGRACCVVGDVCVPRKRAGRHFVAPLHSDIQVRARRIGLDCLTPILWHKISNGVTEAKGNGAGFCGKPYQPGSVVKNDVEHILFLRKGGQYRSVSPLKKALSMLTKEEMQGWLRSLWTDLRGTSTRKGHPAPYPVELAERLIKLFSFAGDTVLDPFAGTGSTAIAAMNTGRNSVSVDVEEKYLTGMYHRLIRAAKQRRPFGANEIEVEID